MTDAAIIAGALVDMKNVSTHKCMRLIIDVPAENALKVIAAFGWPTMVNPVSVAVARLRENANELDEGLRQSAGTEQLSSGAGEQIFSDERLSRIAQRASPVSEPDGQLSHSSANRNRTAEITTTPRPDQSVGVPAGADKPPKSPAQIAGYLCTLGSFQTFLRERFTDQWVPNAIAGRSKEEVAKETLYDICTVTSRTQLTKDNTEWNALQLAYKLWEREAEVVPA